MNVLCLVELDEAGVTDASLRALTFARSLAAAGPGGAARSWPPSPSGRPSGSRPACSARTG